MIWAPSAGILLTFMEEWALGGHYSAVSEVLPHEVTWQMVGMQVSFVIYLPHIFNSVLSWFIEVQEIDWQVGCPDSSFTGGDTSGPLSHRRTVSVT